MDFAKILKREREKRGWSQRELANKLGVTNPAICNWEAGKREPAFEQIEAIAELFGCSLQYLLGVPKYEDDGGYYVDSETAEIAQEVFDKPELRVLFDASRDVSKEDILYVAQMLEKLKK